MQPMEHAQAHAQVQGKKADMCGAWHGCVQEAQDITW